jgi:hypothetical protein
MLIHGCCSAKKKNKDAEPCAWIPNSTTDFLGSFVAISIVIGFV